MKRRGLLTKLGLGILAAPSVAKAVADKPSTKIRRFPSVRDASSDLDLSNMKESMTPSYTDDGGVITINKPGSYAVSFSNGNPRAEEQRAANLFNKAFS